MAELVRVRPSLAALERLRDAPHEMLLDLSRRQGPFVRYGLGRLSFFLLSDPEDVKSVLVAGGDRFDKATFQYRLLASVTGEGLLTMDGSRWLERRRSEQPFFHLNAVESWRGLIERRVEALCVRWEGLAESGRPADVADEMLRLALEIIVGVLFEDECESESSDLVRATMTVLGHIMRRARTLGAIPPWLPTRGNRDFRDALRILDERIERAIRRAGDGPAPEGNLLTYLMGRTGDEQAGRLDRRALRDEVITMIIAGHETVASALGWTLHLLAHHPEHLDTIAEASESDVDAARAAFHEALRLYPPAWIITRRAARRSEIGGVTIPRGSLVVVSPYVIQRRRELWPDPDTFEPSRFAVGSGGADRTSLRHGFLPFGAGPHLCIGLHLARLEAEIAIAALARRFRFEPQGAEVVAVEAGVTLHPADGLPMKIARR